MVLVGDESLELQEVPTSISYVSPNRLTDHEGVTF